LDGGELFPLDTQLSSSDAEVVADARDQLFRLTEEADDLRPDLLFHPACFDPMGSAARCRCCGPLCCSASVLAQVAVVSPYAAEGFSADAEQSS
jgi:hypothetical protein